MKPWLQYSCTHCRESRFTPSLSTCVNLRRPYSLDVSGNRLEALFSDDDEDDEDERKCPYADDDGSPPTHLPVTLRDVYAVGRGFLTLAHFLRFTRTRPSAT